MTKIVLYQGPGVGGDRKSKHRWFYVVRANETELGNSYPYSWERARDALDNAAECVKQHPNMNKEGL